MSLGGAYERGALAYRNSQAPWRVSPDLEHKMRKRDFAALLILIAAYYILKGVGGLIERGGGLFDKPK
jgi:hypothetical protein